MSEPPGPTDESNPTDSPKPEYIPAVSPMTAAPEPDVRGLAALCEAARPLVMDVITGTQNQARDKYAHELRVAELAASQTEAVHRRLYPLLCIAVLLVAGLIGLAAFRDNWTVVTHLLTAMLGVFSGYGIGQQQQRRSKANTPDD